MTNEVSTQKSLAEAFPSLATQAHGWDPKNISAGSGKKLEWKCSKGHLWIASPNQRTSKEPIPGCPVCSNRKSVAGVNDLLTTHPEIAKMITSHDPTTLTKISRTVVLWKCDKGHEWKESVSNRTGVNSQSGKGYGCPYCTGKKVLAGFNDLKTTHPEIANEAHGWDPSEKSAGSHFRAKWICKSGHIWEVTINSRTNNKTGCPTCANQTVQSGYNDLKTKFPDIAKEAYGWDPEAVMSGSPQKREWQCPQGHIYVMAVGNRTGQKQGCHYCSGKKVLKGFNDLETNFPDLSKEANGWDPSTVVWGSHKRGEWKCSKGHVWSAVIANRSLLGHSCPVCSGRKLLSGFNDLQTKFPEIAKEAHGWDPTKIHSGSSQRVEWICEKGHVWDTTVVSRTFNLTGCPVCGQSRYVLGINDFQTRFPDLAKQAYGWDPTKIPSASQEKLEWKCEKGHVWVTTPFSRIYQGAGCLVCSNRQVLFGFNDLATTHPEIAFEANGWDPRTVTAGSGKKLSWKCNLGHIWETAVSTRTIQGSGCPSCSITGFDPNKDGWIYLLEHPEWGLHQIGISNVIEKRLRTHQNLGWEVIDLRGPLQGDVTYEWEQSILKTLKSEGANFEHNFGKFTGYTESWVKSSYSVEKIFTLMQLVEDSERHTL
jgi:hypothetical protein